MRHNDPPSPAVVVGIDGSRRAVDAALWAVEEAVERDVPLRLVYAIEPSATRAGTSAACDFATAESAVRHVAMAIESTNRPVKIEVEIIQGSPVQALMTASRGALMVCLGALGVNHALGRRVGSTVTGLVAHAHCPVAIVGSAGHRPGRRYVMTSCHDGPDDAAVVTLAVEEAVLRQAPLRVLTRWHPSFTDVHDGRSFAEGARQAAGRLERSLHRHRQRHPGLDIEAVAIKENPVDYYTRHAQSIDVVVVGHGVHDELSRLLGPEPRPPLDAAHVTVLIAERHGAL